MWRCVSVAAGSVVCLLLVGCASTQLDYNALDLAGSIDDLLTSQVIFNLGRFLQNPSGTPAQVSIGTGSVTTTNQGSLSLSSPLTTAVTTTNTAATAAGAVIPAITRTTAGVANAFTLTPSATNQATQNWSLTTDTSSDQERRLRALYRYATRAIDWRELCKEYALISTNPMSSASPPGNQPVTEPVLDGQLLREPGCIICSKTANANNISVLSQSRACPRSTDLYVNARLTHDWLVPMQGEYSDTQLPRLSYIGSYRGINLYTKDNEQFHQFVMFVLEATNLGSTAGQSGKNSAPARLTNPAPAQPSFVIPSPGG